LGEPESLISKAVELEPNNQKALWLHGMIFYEKGNLIKTNEVWTNLYDLMQDESTKSQLLEQLNDVRNQLGIASQTNKSQVPAIAKNALVTITVNVDEVLLSQLDNKPAVLYVYTKESSGMPMPIAVARQSLEQINKSFPITVALTDADSLQSTRKLSGFERVKIGARISFSGNATPQSGDFESTELEIDIPSSELIELSINSIKN
jgi:cytochrome c-type biogenesis protein CcmH